jgi:cyanophycinase
MARDRQAAGRLLVIGGAEGLGPGGDGVLARFVELAGGPDAELVVIATATKDPATREAEYEEVFTRLGAGRVVPLRLATRAQANSDEAVAALASATGVFFTGGDQLRITSVLGGSRVDSALHARLTDNIVLAGTSAGAAMMASTMITGGADASVHTGPGLEFLPGVLIDMHFAARGRLHRLLAAVSRYPHELGLGIDEDTAILVSGGRFEVLGSGAVTVIDAGPASGIRSPDDDGGPTALCDVRLHLLPAGCAFELTERRPVLTDQHPVLTDQRAES